MSYEEDECFREMHVCLKGKPRSEQYSQSTPSSGWHTLITRLHLKHAICSSSSTNLEIGFTHVESFQLAFCYQNWLGRRLVYVWIQESKKDSVYNTRSYCKAGHVWINICMISFYNLHEIRLVFISQCYAREWSRLQDYGAIARIPNEIQIAHQQQGLWPSINTPRRDSGMKRHLFFFFYSIDKHDSSSRFYRSW